MTWHITSETATTGVLNWLDTNGDIMLHFNPRLSERELVMNTCDKGSWGDEERLPYDGRPIDAQVVATSVGFEIRFNGAATVFKHRKSFSAFSQLSSPFPSGWNVRDPTASSSPSSAFFFSSSTQVDRLPATQRRNLDKEAKAEEEDEIMKDLGLSLRVGEAATLRISIWDFGGQRVFQSVQHLLIVRRAVYFVVFNMETFIYNVDSSFSYLDFWLHTIVIQAQDAPIFLIGTRGDLVDSTKHTAISNALELRYAKIIGENAIEKNGDLYFFPVDNTSEESADVDKFKDISARTEKRILTDKLEPLVKVSSSEKSIPYVEDKVPIPWIDFYDKLKMMASRSDEEHDPVSYLATGLLSTADDVGDTAMSIAMECKVFDNLVSIEEQKMRLHLVLTSLNDLGVVVYFGHTESLRGYVILQPQWLMDQICFVIRDFRRHRLRRDERKRNSSKIGKVSLATGSSPTTC